MYRNPVIDADWPDLDVIADGDGFLLVASSFTRSPGLPLLASTNLVDWRLAGHALERNLPEERFDDPTPGSGVWAPSIRRHDGRLHIYWADPDEGVWTISAPERGTNAGETDAAAAPAADPHSFSGVGPWTAPRMVLAGTGIIDPCPLFDDDGRVWLAHGWARSRSGRDNRLDLVELDAGGQHPIGQPRVLIDGADIAGCSVLEGPKLYRARGSYWVFAPAGGVATGWQYVFRAPSLSGPWEHRIVLSQGATDVNGPHQGAWVTTPAGEDWFLHFQDRGWAGRVVHLQPMAWDDEGWPVVGDGGEPVSSHPVPAALPGVTGEGPSVADDWENGIGRQWAWQANPPRKGAWGAAIRGALELPAGPSATGDPRALGAVLAQPMPGDGATLRVELAIDGGVARGGVVVLGETALACTLEISSSGVRQVVARVWDDDDGVVVAEVPVAESAATVEIAVDRPGRCRASVVEGDRATVLVEGWQATAGRWVGAAFGLFATRPPGSVDAVLRVGPVRRL